MLVEPELRTCSHRQPGPLLPNELMCWFFLFSCTVTISLKYFVLLCFGAEFVVSRKFAGIYMSLGRFWRYSNQEELLEPNFQKN